MNLQPGSILTATASPDDPIFDNVSILITEYNEKGALGFMIGQLFPRRFNELEEFKHSPAFPIYEGGPIDQEHLYFIHRRPDLVEEGTLIAGNIYFGGNFKQAVTHINNNNLTEKDIIIFIGYCGWDAGQLEEELEDGSWIVTDEEIVFPADFRK